MRKLKLFFACLLMAVLSIGQMWGAVVSGTTYEVKSAATVPDGWSVTNSYSTGGGGYAKLTYTDKSILTDGLCQDGFTSIVIKARKYGSPSNEQAVITVEWCVAGSDDVVLGTVTPTSTTLTNYTISSPASVTANQSGNIRISCKGAGSDKGSGVSEVTINFKAGNCQGGDPDPGENPDPNPQTGDSYEKVTSAPTDWSGEYLLVYESNNNAYVWTGVDAANCYVSTSISNGVIAKPEGVVTLTIAKEGAGYSLLINGGANDGKYITDNTSNAALKFATTAYATTISYESNWTKILFSERCIRFNNGTSSGMRFRFYAATSQQPIQLYKKAGEAPAVAKPNILGETPFLNSTSVTITIPEGTTVYYTTDGSNPKTSETKQTYSASFNLDANATVKAIATDGANWSEVAEKPFVKGTAMTVAEARAAIDAGGDLTNKFVAGTISKIDSYQSGYHSITYWISDDGTTTNQLEVYSGLAGVVKEQFESINDLAVGDDVTVKGTLKKYGSTYEFDYNNTIKAYKPIARLAWSAESYAADIDNLASNEYPTLTNTNGVTIAYSSTNTNAATIDPATGDITLVAVGSTTIQATFAGNDSYKANSASYTLNVGSSVVHATISFDVDGGTAIDPLTDKQEIVLADLPAAVKAGKNFGGWFKDVDKTIPVVAEALTGDITLHAKWLDPYTITEAKAVIDAAPAGTANQYVTGIISKIDSYQSNYHSITYWISADGTTDDQLQVYSGLIGNAATALEKTQFTAKTDLELGDEVVVCGTLKLHNTTYEFDYNNYIYTFSRKASAGLEYAETAVNKIVGDDEFINPLTNPNSVAVTYGTSDDQVAEVANDGTVTINGEGSAIITATFAGNDQYKAASVSYTVTVSAAAPVLTDYYEKVTATENITDGTYLIVYENGNVAFNGGLETLDAESNTIAVEITNDHKIGVTTATEAATFFIDVTAGSIQAANGKYIGVSSNSNSLKTSDDASTYTNAFAIDNDGNAVISAVFSESTMTMRYNSANNQARFRYYKNGQQPIQLYKLANETVKANPELEWSAESVTITVGDEFIAPTLSHKEGFTGTITFASDNESLATVSNAGVISLEAEATGTAHITASFAGDDTYKAVNVACTITVNAAAPVPAGTDNVIILAVYDEKYYAMSTTNANNGFTAIAVEYDGSQITVKSEAEKTAIQWTRTTNGDNTTFQDADSKYMKSADGASMSLDANVCNWLWDATGGYYKISGTSRTFFFQNTSGGIFKNYATSNLGGNGYSNKAQVIVIAEENIVITAKVSAELAYDPAEVELTVGDDFTPAALTYAEGFDGLATVTYESSNTDLATVEGGVVSLVADATGTATITATFAGNNNYLAGSASYTITVNAPAPVPTTTTYRKVTATEEITDGEYLIVYETTSVAFNGALETLDAEGNSVAVVINEGVIAGTTAIDAAVFTIDVTAGTLKSASGKYIGVSSNSNGLKQTEDANTYTHTFSIDGDGNAVIFANFESSTMKLRYNPSTNAGNLRFRYYKNDGQQAIQLYKKESATPPTPVYETVRAGLEANRYYTLCFNRTMDAVQGATFWSFASKDADVAYLVQEDAPYAAGKPYIIYAEAAGDLTAVLSGEEVTTTVANGALYGTFAPMGQAALDAAGENIYLLMNNQLRRVDGQSGNNLPAYRAYIDLDEIENTGAPANVPAHRVRAIPMQPQTATGIGELNLDETPMKLIINGQLIIIRGEKMFNANGQLVK